MKFRIKTKVGKFFYWVGGVIVMLLAIIVILSLGEGSHPPYVTGVTFRYIYARDELKLDWQKVYISILDDLKVRNIRLPVYWDDIEKTKGTYDFTNLDFEMSNAQSRGAEVILAIGRRAPGWPECHIPDWAASESQDQQEQDLLDEMHAIVNRYAGDSALQEWQIENEPFLTKFGTCPTLPVAQDLKTEVAFVRQLDPYHPILTTDSGELSTWLPAASQGDDFGSTLYRNVYVDHLKRYMSYFYIEPIFYRAKEGLVHLFYPHKQIINIELQAEPWTHDGIDKTTFAEQAITLPPGAITKNLQYAHNAGFSTVYLWGVEYWYWAEAQGHPEFYQEAKKILNP